MVEVAASDIGGGWPTHQTTKCSMWPWDRVMLRVELFQQEMLLANHQCKFCTKCLSREPSFVTLMVGDC